MHSLTYLFLTGGINFIKNTHVITWHKFISVVTFKHLTLIAARLLAYVQIRIVRYVVRSGALATSLSGREMGH